MMDLAEYEVRERAKYDKIWSMMDYSSRCQEEFYRFIRPYVFGTCLEVGCGRGKIVDRLNREGLLTVGTDISLIGVLPDTLGYFHPFPSWDLRFLDKSFDTSFSSDVLEHIPTELIPLVIRELDRVTSGITLHDIATFDDHEYFEEKVHLTVRPMGWWVDQFRDCRCKVILRERRLWQ